MDKNAKRFAIGAVVAAGIGYVAGVLTAPKSGKETRKDIQNTVLKARAEAEKKLKSLNSELNILLDQAKTKGAKLSGTAKTQLATAVTNAQKAKVKVRNILSAVHEGDADDEDLQKAIKEATSAAEHLKSYVKKMSPAKKQPDPKKDYEQIGRMVASIYESGYVDKGRTYKMSFIKGLLGGFGGVLGATVVVALLLWFLSFFHEVPLLGPVVETVQHTIEEH